MAAEGAGGAAARAAAGGKQLTLAEAELILGIESGATWQEIMKVCAGGVSCLLCCSNCDGNRRLSPAPTAAPLPDASPHRIPPQKFDHLYAANERSGSFYLQSKVYRAKERLEQEFEERGLPMDPPPQPPPEGGDSQQQQHGGGGQ